MGNERDRLQADHDALIQKMATKGYTLDDIRTSEQQLRQLDGMQDDEGE